MLRLVKDNTAYDFLGKRKFFFGLSLFLFLATVVSLFVHGLNYGIDFSGGTMVEIRTAKTVDVAHVRHALTTGGFEGATIQQYGGVNDFLIRLPVKEGETLNTDTLSAGLHKALSATAGTFEVRRTEFVGPQVGEELRMKGVEAILLSMVAILLYISVRFEFRYGVGAVVSIVHDVMFTVGIFSVLQKEVSLTVLAALLTIVGYSLNDTIVVFDRIRENIRKYPNRPLLGVLNQSVNEMLNRTLMTSLTTIIVLVSLLFLGGEVIHDFAFTLIFGMIVGTYSSTFVAAPVVFAMDKYYRDKPNTPSVVDPTVPPKDKKLPPYHTI